MVRASCSLVLILAGMTTMASTGQFNGRHINGKGDTAYLQALDDAYSMLQPASDMACLPMLYRREWNGLVEGPTWDAWWIQNSFGPSYTMMPFLEEPYRTWLTNSQAMWFVQMADGKKADRNGYVAPAGCLCDCATPTGVYYRQGDGRVAEHDWCIGFTVAGLLLQSELMLVKRDRAEIDFYLPKLEAVAAFLDARRDPQKDLLLGGVASNLLAPSYGGWLKADGTRDKAYLSELSVNYVAALDRLIEVCKLAHRPDKAAAYAKTRDKVRAALNRLLTPEGYFIHALNPDGTKQGVFGAPKSGYFESAPNHDSVCFRVVDDAQAKTIVAKMLSIPELRPNKLILPNYPTYDTMYETGGLFTYGTWVNGGHWTTAEARMMMAYARVGQTKPALEAFGRILELARAFRADNNLVDRGAKLYQPGQPYNVVYDCWGAPGALLRGVFEYEFKADGLRLYPHLPKGVTGYTQTFPVIFGKKRLFLTASGSGPITRVLVDGKPVKEFDAKSVFVKLGPAKQDVRIDICLGGAKASAVADGDLGLKQLERSFKGVRTTDTPAVSWDQLDAIRGFWQKLEGIGFSDTYEARHARVVLDMVEAMLTRRENEATPKPPTLPGIPPADLRQVDNLYGTTVENLSLGLIDALKKTKSKAIRDAAVKAGLIEG
jgi:hypothetical protein